MAKRIMPEENIEYTFSFSPEKKMTYRWFGEFKQKLNGQTSGRYLFYNMTTGRYTDMTLAYFQFLCRRHLTSRLPANYKDINPLTGKKYEEPTIPVKVAKKEVEDKDNSDAVLELAKVSLGWMSELSERDKYALKVEYGEVLFDVAKITADLKKIIRGTLEQDKIDDVLSLARRTYCAAQKFSWNKGGSVI